MTWLLNPLVPIEQEAGWAPSCDLDAMEKSVLPLWESTHYSSVGQSAA